MNRADRRFGYLLRAGIVVVLLSAGSGVTRADTLYKWVDQDGVTHYSNLQPGGVNAQVVNEHDVNVIPGDAASAPVTAGASAPQTAGDAADGDAKAAALAARRSAMIQNCEDNNGVDCAQEVDTELAAEAQTVHQRINRNIIEPGGTRPAK